MRRPRVELHKFQYIPSADSRLVFFVWPGGEPRERGMLRRLRCGPSGERWWTLDRGLGYAALDTFGDPPPYGFRTLAEWRRWFARAGR